MAKISEESRREIQLLKRRVRALMAEYHLKVQYDFSRYIYVGAKNEAEPLQSAVDAITTCAGYEAHRQVWYKSDYVSNLYVRFADYSYAMEAANRLTLLEKYCVDNVGAMLVSWYLEEMLKGKLPWTLAIVSISGRADYTNPLSQDSLQDMLVKFGDPRISTYQKGNLVTHAQVLFSSMSEALGASIATGRWFRGDALEESKFYYQIQIMSSDKEAALLRALQPDKCEASPLKAFEMDYFVQKLETNKVPSYDQETPYWSNSAAQNSARDSRSPRPREFTRQFSRGKSNGWKGKGRNPYWLNESQGNARRFPNPVGQNVPVQEFAGIQSS